MAIELGILVHGDNHFIVRGPQPDRAAAVALARHWSFIQIGTVTPPALRPWSISSREFREDLQWAAVVPGEREILPVVKQLLAELAARGIAIHTFPADETGHRSFCTEIHNPNQGGECRLDT